MVLFVYSYECRRSRSYRVLTIAGFTGNCGGAEGGSSKVFQEEPERRVFGGTEGLRVRGPKGTREKWRGLETCIRRWSRIRRLGKERGYG